jgi:GNAT superfamily N-acetyltransferase
LFDIALLDELAANARPARVQQALEGWRLRASDGVTRRANSVLTNAPLPLYPRWFEEVEEFYRRHNLPSRYQISAASPPELDNLLNERGYTYISETSVMVGTVQDVLDQVRSTPESEVTLQDRVSDKWLTLFLDAEGFPTTQESSYRHTFSSLGPAVAYATATIDNQPAGVGMSVAERGWAGLFSIVTFPTYRRQGVGTAIVRALAAWARQHGSEQLYLQVVATNEPAVNLYRRLGFDALYSYHYREKSLP